MSFALYTAELADPHLRKPTPQRWRDWAQRVKRHQRQLYASFEKPVGLPVLPPGKPIPWHLEDLAAMRTPMGMKGIKGWPGTSRYYGVMRTHGACKYPGWYAFQPRNARQGRKRLGWFPTELEAATAVLRYLNPLAEIPTTPAEQTP